MGACQRTNIGIHKINQKPRLKRRGKQNDMKLIITDHGDTTVGIFPQTWAIECPFDKQDSEFMEDFRADIMAAYSHYCEGKMSADYDFQLIADRAECKTFQIGDKVRDPKTGCEGEIIDIDGDMYQIKSEQNAKRINNDGYECPLTFWCKETDFVKGHYPDYF